MPNVEPKVGDRVIVKIKRGNVEPALQRERVGLLKKWREGRWHNDRDVWIVKLEDFPQAEIWAYPEDVLKVVERGNDDGTITRFE
jgi:hypothetical protein